MQTFLPYEDFHKSVGCLDRQRLGCQRKEAWQILNALTGIKVGWRNHPAVKMWDGYELALMHYYNCALKEWAARGYKNVKLQPFTVDIDSIVMPPWIGNPNLHASHRSNLLRKDPSHYG
ncbi:MAG: MSMEG_6728 family protein, partial [Acidiferrobacterales bacterium]|nr:MSMEG_6728 family protein [Acidiferrobacterales bacterium]